MIQGIGVSNPKIMFIGDTPHGDDIKTNYALSGYQYNFIRDGLSEVGLDIVSCYRTLLLKDEPPTTSQKGGVAIPGLVDDLVTKFTPILLDEITQLHPFLLVPMGELSFRLLTGLKDIRKFRGSVLSSIPILTGEPATIKVLPILGPYPFINKDYKYRYVSRIDFQKIPSYLNDGPIPDLGINVWIAENATALRNFLNRAYTAEGLLVFDIETFMGIPTCISLCFDGIESVCVPLLDKQIDEANRILMWDLVAKTLDSPIAKGNQNVKYDWKILERWGLRVRNVCHDSMLAFSTLYAEFPKNLGFLTSLYTDLPYFKDEGKEFDPTKIRRTQFYLYNAKDSLAAHKIISKEIVEMDEGGTTGVYSQLMKVMPIYRAMEDRGVAIDDSVRQRLLGKYWSMFRVQTHVLNNLMSTTGINPLSNPTADRIIFTELGYDRSIRGVKGGDQESLELLMVYGQPKNAPNTGRLVLECFINCRRIHKVIELLSVVLYPDYRFRCEYNLAGTETGRTSAGKSLDTIFLLDIKNRLTKRQLGRSLQTIGKHGFVIDGVTYGQEIREMFVPSYGYSFVEIDLSQAEARVDAVLSKDYDILEVFDGPVGIHKTTGSWIFSCDPSEIKKNILVTDPVTGIAVDRYHAAKTVRHAAERNMLEGRLAIMLQIPLPEARKILKTVHSKQPNIQKVFHKDVIAALKISGCLVAPNGRRRDFFGRLDNATYNEGISTLPQAIVGDLNKFALIPTIEKCPWAYPLVEAHDSILFECPIGREEELAVVHKRNVEVPIDFRSCTLPRDYQLVIPAEVETSSENWKNLKEMKLW